MAQETQKGTIECLVTDGESGPRYCSVCLRYIEIQRIDRLPYPCPDCGSELSFGSPQNGQGGER